MTIQIKPTLDLNFNCHNCQGSLEPSGIFWQGMNICAKATCNRCHAEILSSLPVGHTIHHPFQVDVRNNSISGSEPSQSWLSGALLKSLKSPQDEKVNIRKEILRQADSVIILNCIDYLYGHCLLKLLNAQRHLEKQSSYGVVVIIQPFLRWMVPDGIAEIWTVDLPLKNGALYHPNLNEFIHKQSQRFREIKVSKAYSHPSQFDIKKFTRTFTESSDQERPQITFIWREDRLWCNPILERRRTLKKLNLISAILWVQNLRIQRLFRLVRKELPKATFSVAGLGTRTKFPDWIEDARVKSFDAASEQRTCQLYANTNLVIGVHGSSLLLPSGHAEMTLDLMPKDRWGNYAQDILYQEQNSRIASFRYRYIPLTTNISLIAYIAQNMLLKYSTFQSKMRY